MNSEKSKEDYTKEVSTIVSFNDINKKDVQSVFPKAMTKMEALFSISEKLSSTEQQKIFEDFVRQDIIMTLSSMKKQLKGMDIAKNDRKSFKAHYNAENIIERFNNKQEKSFEDEFEKMYDKLHFKYDKDKLKDIIKNTNVK